MEKKCWLHNLGFLHLKIHGKTIQALVDTSATHNFMTIWLGKVVGMYIVPKDVEAKKVKSGAKVSGLENDVPIQIADWQGCFYFTVMEMNNVDMILG